MTAEAPGARSSWWLGKGDVLTGAVHTASAAREGIEAAVKVAEPGNFASVWTMSRDAATDWAKLGVLDDKVPGVIRIMVPKPSGEPSWRRTASSSGAEWRWATRGTPGPSPTGTRVTRRRLTRPSASSVTPVQGQVRQAAMPIQARLVRGVPRIPRRRHLDPRIRALIGPTSAFLRRLNLGFDLTSDHEPNFGHRGLHTSFGGDP